MQIIMKEVINMARIAVQNGLEDYAAYLSNAGYDVVPFNKSKKSNSSFFEEYDAVILSEFEDDLLQLEQDNTDTSAINEGMLNNQDTVFHQAAINTDMVNQNEVGLRMNSEPTSKPTVFVNRKSVEQVKAELDSIFNA
jgi:hypothetical protein